MWFWFFSQIELHLNLSKYPLSVFIMQCLHPEVFHVSLGWGLCFRSSGTLVFRFQFFPAQLCSQELFAKLGHFKHKRKKMYFAQIKVMPVICWHTEDNPRSQNIVITDRSYKRLFWRANLCHHSTATTVGFTETLVTTVKPKYQVPDAFLSTLNAFSL